MHVVNNTGLSPCCVLIFEVNILASSAFLSFIERFVLLKKYLIMRSFVFFCNPDDLIISDTFSNIYVVRYANNHGSKMCSECNVSRR